MTDGKNTEVRSQEAVLLPCPFCGGEAIHENYPDSRDHHVFCDVCLGRTDAWSTKLKAVNNWNRRAVPATQWSSEPPTEKGFYWAVLGQVEKIITMVFINANNRVCSKINCQHCMILLSEIPNFTAECEVQFWLPITPPPMPERREK